jgi:hypothetical protein
MERKFHQVRSLGEADGWDLVRQLLQISRELACMPEDEMLQMSEEGKIPSKDNDGRGGESLVSARAM